MHYVVPEPPWLPTVAAVLDKTTPWLERVALWLAWFPIAWATAFFSAKFLYGKRGGAVWRWIVFGGGFYVALSLADGLWYSARL